MKELTISVLMSVYNGEAESYFGESLNSILTQTKLPNEFVLVIDGEVRAELEEVVEKYSKLFLSKGVNFIVHRNGSCEGLGAALNKGAKYCTSDFILRMDSDDISINERIEAMYLLITQNPDIDVIGGQTLEFIKVPNDINRKRLVPLDLKSISSFALKRNPMNHVTVCIKRESLEAIGGYDSVFYHEDYFLWIKFITKGYKLLNVDKILVYVRVGNDLIGRRIGWRYFKHELNFVQKSKELGFFSPLTSFYYLFPRFFLRLMPKVLLSFVYKLLRN